MNDDRWQLTYDDWKTTDPSDADYCSNGHYHCPPCPLGREHPSCECENEHPDDDDFEPDCNTEGP